jgi:hypothetical protein
MDVRIQGVEESSEMIKTLIKPLENKHLNHLYAGSIVHD